MAIIFYWYVCVISRFQDFFFPALLRYNWHITQCKFKAYSTLIWYMYLHRKMITAIALANISITSHNYHFFSFFLSFFLWEYLQSTSTSLVAQTVKRLSTMQDTRVRALGWDDPLEGNGNSLQYYHLENPMDGGAW